MPIQRRIGTAAPLGACVLLAGCSGWQSALDPQGPQARDLSTTFWTFTAALGLVWVLTMLALALALWRARGARDAPLESTPRPQGRAIIVTAAASGATVAILFALAGLSFAMQRRVTDAPPAGLSVAVTGYQWWWHIAYEGPEPAVGLVTANELHLPAGVPVRIRLASADVIHSLWVPNLFGKQDLIPGIDNAVELVASRPSVLRGQCAEFCGLQHAHMALTVVVQSKAEFDAWAAAQRQPAQPPADDKRRAGQAVFAARSCPVCHSVRGTDAAGAVGPDLTHVASRRRIASGLLPMTRSALASWIADPHAHKPGVHMPATPLEPHDAEALLDYLEGLT